MISIKKHQIAKDMITAARGVFDEKWPEAKDYAESESKKLAESLAMITK